MRSPLIPDTEVDRSLVAALRITDHDAAWGALKHGANYRTYFTVHTAEDFVRLAGSPDETGMYDTFNGLFCALVEAGANASMEAVVDGVTRTPLLHACTRGSTGNLRFLLGRNVPSTQLVAGTSAFVAVCAGKVEEHAIECVTALAEASEQAAVRKCEADVQRSALIIACETSRVNLASALLRCGSALSSADKSSGDTALHVAAANGNAVLLDTLASDAEAEDLQTAKAHRNKAGKTPWQVAQAAGLGADVLQEMQQLLA